MMDSNIMNAKSLRGCKKN